MNELDEQERCPSTMDYFGENEGLPALLERPDEKNYKIYPLSVPGDSGSDSFGQSALMDDPDEKGPHASKGNHHNTSLFRDLLFQHDGRSHKHGSHCS